MITIENFNVNIENLNLFEPEMEDDLNAYYEEDGIEYCVTPEGETYFLDAETDEWILCDEEEMEIEVEDESDDSED